MLQWPESWGTSLLTRRQLLGGEPVNLASAIVLGMEPAMGLPLDLVFESPPAKSEPRPERRITRATDDLRLPVAA